MNAAVVVMEIKSHIRKKRTRSVVKQNITAKKRITVLEGDMSYQGFTRSVIIKLMIPGYRNVVIENYMTSVKILNITNAVGRLYTVT